jgi:lipoprotein-releasing system permease protein
MRYEYFIGLRYLRAKRRQTFVSVITAIAVAGVTVGVAALIIVLSGMVGVQEYMRDKILGFNAHITVVSAGEDGISDPAEVVETLLQVPHVMGASPYIQGQLMLRGRGGSAGVLVRGIDPQTAPTVMALEGDSTIISGAIAELDPSYQPQLTVGAPLPALAIGQPLAQELGAYYGDEVTLIVPEGVVTPVGLRPNAMRVPVGGI